MVYVIDDNDFVQRSLQSLCRLQGLVCETFTSTQAFLAFPKKEVPSCLILDAGLHLESGLDFQRRLCEMGLRFPIVMIADYHDVPMAVQAMKAGAVDVITKPFRHHEIIDAINHALRRDVAQLSQRRELSALRSRYASLSVRERSVLAYVVEGLLNKQIADRLGIQEVTVKAHRAAAMKKLGCGSLVDLLKTWPTLVAGGVAPSPDRYAATAMNG